MEPRYHLWQKHIKEHPYATGAVIALMVALFIFLAYWFNWDWTGFNSGTNQIIITSTSKGNYTATISQPSKSLWDWLQLLGILAIPVVVGLGAVWYTERHSHDLQIMAENQRETALQAFIDKIPDFKLLKDNLAGTKAQIILNARTSALFPSLDANRKGTALRFLYELKLVYRRKFDEKLQYPIIKLKFADLSGANLTGISLTMADLSYTNLRNADLRNADLVEADLRGADLTSADLTGANLKGVTGITIEELDKQAYSLKDATMPDGSKHP